MRESQVLAFNTFSVISELSDKENGIMWQCFSPFFSLLNQNQKIKPKKAYIDNTEVIVSLSSKIGQIENLALI